MVVPEKLLMKKIKKREKVKKQLASKQQNQPTEESAVAEPECKRQVSTNILITSSTFIFFFHIINKLNVLSIS